jgi:hypothetical protein
MNKVVEHMVEIEALMNKCNEAKQNIKKNVEETEASQLQTELAQAQKVVSG